MTIALILQRGYLEVAAPGQKKKSDIVLSNFRESWVFRPQTIIMRFWEFSSSFWLSVRNFFYCGTSLFYCGTSLFTVVLHFLLLYFTFFTVVLHFKTFQKTVVLHCRKCTNNENQRKMRKNSNMEFVQA